MKLLIWVGMIVGSTVGGFIPVIFGSSLFSVESLIANAVGGILGIVIAYKIGTNAGL